jgi:alkanesulfonate monooxygenase SsuD/methylene tetrahydromethanopterin reductase-like flavin-dependent oxidoreductase (luciferase family)
LAIQWASLDQLSGGRTILAVCLGKGDLHGPRAAAEIAAFGVASRERVSRLEEGIELLRRLWSDGPVTFEGRHYRYEQVEILPKPAQARLPIMLAGLSATNVDPKIEERVLRRTARVSDGWQTSSIPPEKFKERWARIQQYADEYGRTEQMTEAVLHLLVNLNDDPKQGYRDAAEFLTRYYGDREASRHRLDSAVCYGPPERLIERIRGYVAAGVTTPVIRFTSLDQLGQLNRCLAEVLPAFDGVAVG